MYNFKVISTHNVDYNDKIGAVVKGLIPTSIFSLSDNFIVPAPVRAPQVGTESSNSPSVVKQIQEQEIKAADSPSQTNKTEEPDGKVEDVKKEKKKVKKPKAKV